MKLFKILLLLLISLSSYCYSSESQEKLKEDYFDAAYKGELKQLQEILKTGIDVNIRNDDGVTALIFASQGGYIDIVKLLLDHNANVNIQSNNKTTALMVGSQNGHIEVVKSLLNHNAKINVQDNYGTTALIFASQDKHTEIVKLLLDHNAKINVQTINGFTALMVGSQNGHIEVVKSLLDHNADTNTQSYGFTALTIATCHRYTEIVKLLNNYIDQYLPYINKHKEIQNNSLLVHLPDVLVDIIKKYYPQLTFNEFLNIQEQLKLVKSLLNNSDINIQNNNSGNSSLMLASNSNHKELVELLSNYILEQKKANIIEQIEQTAIDAACCLQ